MNKVNKAFTHVYLSIVLMATIGILGTFMSDYLTSINWFGDYECIYYGEHHNCWGARHYWYNWTVAILFIVSLVRTIVKVVCIVEEK